MPAGARWRPNAADDKCPKDKPNCSNLPGSEPDVRRAFNSLPKDMGTYGPAGTSNTVAAEILRRAGVAAAFPDKSWGSGWQYTPPLPMPPLRPPYILPPLFGG
jgi:hypothetical protein